MATIPRDKTRVFISYARADGEQFATDLRARLEQEHPDITLWQDRVKMEGGRDCWLQITEVVLAGPRIHQPNRLFTTGFVMRAA